MYIVTAYCVDVGCRCLDHAGIILYRGSRPADALYAKRHLVPSGYAVEVRRA